YDPAGLDVAALARAIEETGSLADAESGEPVGRDSALELPCDVLVPAAVGGVIDSGNAGRVQAQIVVEGANAPTTPDAEAVLSERGIEIVPDLLANAG